MVVAEVWMGRGLFTCISLFFFLPHFSSSSLFLVRQNNEIDLIVIARDLHLAMTVVRLTGTLYSWMVIYVC